MKNDVGKSLSNVSTEVQKTHGDIVEAFKQKIQEDLVDGWKKIESHFQFESARLAVNNGEELLRRSPDVQSSVGKSSPLFSSRVTKALEVGNSSRKRSTVVARKAKKPRKA